MSFTLPPLPYDAASFAGFASKETFDYHYGKHHNTYVTKLNGFVEGTPYANMELAQVIVESREKRDLKVFNNAAQHYNHSFYWNCLTPQSEAPQRGSLYDAIKTSFGSMASFQEKFCDSAKNLFGSGWTWLVANDQNKLEIIDTKNAESPLGTNKKPLLTCDVWEHAYYIDYRNARPNYVDSFWRYVNWDFVHSNFESK